MMSHCICHDSSLRQARCWTRWRWSRGFCGIFASWYLMLYLWALWGGKGSKEKNECSECKNDLNLASISLVLHINTSSAAGSLNALRFGVINVLDISILDSAVDNP